MRSISLPDMATVMTEHGVKLEKVRSGRLRGVCPLCLGDGKQLVVVPDKQVFFTECCHRGGRIDTFISFLLDVDIYRAWAILKKRESSLLNSAKMVAKFGKTCNT